MDEYRFFVGIDWASQAHEVCVVGAEAKVLERFEVAHSNSGMKELHSRLEHLAGGELSQVAVAIETPRGALVEVLVERGAHVYALNPKQLDRFRDRYSPAGAKDDSRDAFVLGDSLRTDRHCFRRIEPDAEQIIALRETGRMDEELGEELGRVTSRLREQLARYWPQLLGFCPAADEPWLWDLLARASQPAMARRLTRSQVGAVLKNRRIRRLSAPEVLSAFREPALPVAPGTVQAAAVRVRVLVEQLSLLHRQRKSAEARLRVLLECCLADGKPAPGKCADVEILRSLPGVGPRVAATLLGEASQALAARDYQALRSHAGLAPITRQSGKSRRVSMRRACNRRLRNAMYHWARVSAFCDPHSKARYTALRGKGHSHARALRSLADRLLAQLLAMLNDGTLYDPNRTRRVPTVAINPLTKGG